MKIDLITLFPDLIKNFFSYSILNRAIEAGLLEVTIYDLKKYAQDTHHEVDDYIFGGGPGMLIKPEPVFRAMENIHGVSQSRPLVIYPNPQGIVFTQKTANELAKVDHTVYICGHYKGIDRRIIEHWVDREYSLGDYVLSGGEVPAVAMIDATARLVPGVIGDLDSAMSDSFQDGELDGFHYTRPENFEGNKVPGVVLSGHHTNIAEWRKAVRKCITKLRRPDILQKQ